MATGTIQPRNPFIVDQVSTGNFSLAGSTGVTKTVITAKDAYKAIGIVGHNIGGTYQFHINTAIIEGNGDATVIVYNRGTGNITGSVTLYVLYEEV